MQSRKQQTHNPYNGNKERRASRETRARGANEKNRTLGLRLNIEHWHFSFTPHTIRRKRARADGNPLQTIIVRLAGEESRASVAPNCRVIVIDEASEQPVYLS